jgi:type I protein arginine methyltransferase
MSIHLPAPDNISGPNSDPEKSSSSSDGEEDEDETWDDWVSDSNTRQGCKSLFDEKIFSCVEDAMAYDRENYKVDINELCKRLGKCLIIHFVLAQHIFSP